MGEDERRDIKNLLLTLEKMTKLRAGDTHNNFQWLISWFQVDTRKGEQPWTANFPTAVYQIIWNHDRWYLRHMGSSLVANSLIVGGLLAVANIAQDVAISGDSVASIEIPENFDAVCDELNATNFLWVLRLPGHW